MAGPRLPNDFPTDAHRRVAALLTLPRTVRALQRELDADRFVGLGIGDGARIEQMLAALEERGDVANLGDHREADELVSRVQEDDALITMHKDKAAIFRRRAEDRPERYLDDGDDWVLTAEGLARLEGPSVESVVNDLPGAREGIAADVLAAYVPELAPEPEEDE